MPNEPEPQGNLTPKDTSLTSLSTNVWSVVTEMHMQNLRTTHANDFLMRNLDDKEDPEKNSCPTGGCPPDMNLKKDIYWDMMQQSALKDGLNLDIPEERKIEHLKILPLFRQRMREDRKYVAQDKEGPPISDGPEFIIKNGYIYYPAFDKTLMQMYEDQRRLRPEQFDLNEYKTMKLVEQAFLEGRTRVSHIGHNKDINGVDAIRDKITMIYDPETGKGRMEIRNIALEAGHMLSVKEAYDIIRTSDDSFVEGHPKEGVFIFSDAPISSAVVHEVLSEVNTYQSRELKDYDKTEVHRGPDIAEKYRIVRDKAKSDSYYALFTEVSADMPDRLVPSLARGADFIRDRIGGVVDTFTEHIQDERKKIALPFFLKKLLDVSGEDIVETQFIHPSGKLLEDLLTQPKNLVVLQALTELPTQSSEASETRGDISTLWRTRAETMLGITSKQSLQLREDVVTKSYVAQEAKGLVSFVALTEAVIPAGVFALGVLAHPENEEWIDIQINQLAQSPSQHSEAGPLEFIVQLSAEEKERVFSFVESRIQRSDTEQIRLSLPDAVDIETLEVTVDVIRTIDSLPVERKQAAIIRRKEETLREMIALWELIKRTSVRIQVTRTDLSESIHSPQEFGTAEAYATDEKDKKEPLEHFSFALSLWMLLKLANFYSNLEFIHTIITKHEKHSLAEFVTKEKPAELLQKEPTSWLLLSIIWHLAMIREQGLASVAVPIVKKQQHTQKQKKKTQHIPRGFIGQSGLIYVFSS